jgi:arginyl-tRNA--protein-N-Asp/Glu arginylyltransferase
VVDIFDDGTASIYAYDEENEICFSIGFSEILSKSTSKAERDTLRFYRLRYFLTACVEIVAF